jgi:autotransporter translocation and assembly factor TamB
MTDFNKFSRITIDGYAFPADPHVNFDFRHSNLSFSLVLESGTGIVEYSFNGTTLHGDLQIGTPTEAIFFDNRPISKIWLRAKNAGAFGAIVRIEGWIPV